MESVVSLLRTQILLLVWIFYMPFFEVFISIVNCDANGMHMIDRGVECFTGIHIFYVIVCILFLVILFAIGMIISALYNETQPVQEDCLSR